MHSLIHPDAHIHKHTILACTHTRSTRARANTGSGLTNDTDSNFVLVCGSNLLVCLKESEINSHTNDFSQVLSLKRQIKDASSVLVHHRSRCMRRATRAPQTHTPLLNVHLFRCVRPPTEISSGSAMKNEVTWLTSVFEGQGDPLAYS